MRTKIRTLLALLAIVGLAHPTSTALGHGHGGPVAVRGPAAAISAPAFAFYGGYAATAAYAPTTSGYSYVPGAIYVNQPTGAYVPGMSSIPTNYGGYGYAPASYRTAYPTDYWGRPVMRRRFR